MKIRELRIENIKGIKNLALDAIGDVAVIAGPNGCGKSCIFDALRIFKTSYGTYTSQEANQLYNEMGIKIQATHGHRTIFRDPTKYISVACKIELSNKEIENINEVLEDTIKLDVFTSLRPKASAEEMLSLTLPENLRQRFDTDVKEKIEGIRSTLKNEYQYGKVEIAPNGIPTTEENPVLTFIFSHYLPSEIGTIIHVSANRSFNKNDTSSVTLSKFNNDQKNKLTTLYDTNSLINKFHNDLASNYITSLIKKDLAIPETDEKYLDKTIKELFEKFIPNKKYIGPSIDGSGSLRFQVETSDGHKHDVNELSSGEKEVLMGYVQIFGSSPKESILMFDEPELHLNPRLVKSLPEFYKKHLGDHFGNQIWLVTHSDALLSEASKKDIYTVYHITPAEITEDNQAHKISGKNQEDKALLAIVGDLSQYKPDKKIVIVEGEDSEFDKTVIQKLFPEFSNKVNIVSAGPKSKVSSLHYLMENVFRETGYFQKVYGIIDKDYFGDKASSERVFCWDSYHIENYLIIPRIISEITKISNSKNGIALSPEEVYENLKTASKNQINRLAKQRTQSWINQEIIKKIRINCDHRSTTIPDDLETSFTSSVFNVNELKNDILSKQKIKSEFEKYRIELEESTKSDLWKTIFPGREILREFHSSQITWVSYEAFRDLIIDRMQTEKIKPDGMKKVLDLIEP